MTDLIETTSQAAVEVTPANGAEALVRILEEAGIDVVAGIPGHTVGDFALAVGASDKIRPILVRHESTAAFAADVYFRVSGRLMAFFTHAFPGALNAITAAANAYADYSTAFWVTGNTASVGIGRGGYQELSRQFNDDLSAALRPAVKRVWQPRTAGDLAHNALAALREATNGRPGPVALNVSQEIWSDGLPVDSGRIAFDKFVFTARPRPDEASVREALATLAAAERPLILAGNGVNLGRAREQLKRFAELTGIPVATTASGKSSFPETHPLALGVQGWVGTEPANFATRHADTILVLGARLGEPTSSSWTDGATFTPSGTRIIHADIDVAGVANAYPVSTALIGDLGATLEELIAGAETVGRSDRGAWTSSLEEAKLRWADTVAESQDPGTVGRIGTGAVVSALREAYPGPINMVNDCGKHHKWVLQQLETVEDDYIISSMGGASMGIGLAGAIGAHLARPEVPTIAWVGDGGLAMSLSALPTLAEYRLPIVVVVIDDASYGVVHNTQMAQVGRTAFADFDGSGTNPDYRLDFETVAAGCGIPARTVSDPAELGSAFAWAREQEGPVVLTIHSEKTSVQPAGGGVLRPLQDSSRTLIWED